jgi:hypothetical protein
MKRCVNCGMVDVRPLDFRCYVCGSLLTDFFYGSLLDFRCYVCGSLLTDFF